MSDTEKFEGFKRQAHAENERRYGLSSGGGTATASWTRPAPGSLT